jgi:hypothetical protein
MPRFISRGSATPVDDFKESRMRLVDPTTPYRKSGGMGHPGIWCTFHRGRSSAAHHLG